MEGCSIIRRSHNGLKLSWFSFILSWISFILIHINIVTKPEGFLKLARRLSSENWPEGQRNTKITLNQKRESLFPTCRQLSTPKFARYSYTHKFVKKMSTFAQCHSFSHLVTYIHQKSHGTRTSVWHAHFEERWVHLYHYTTQYSLFSCLSIIFQFSNQNSSHLLFIVFYFFKF